MQESPSTRAVAALLRELIEDDSDLIGRTTVVTGSQALRDPGPEARRLLALGASWDWVALRLSSHRFWDLHVGVLPAAGPLGCFHVGLHWSTSIDPAVRPWTETLLPGSKLVFSVAALEHQLTLSDGESRSAFTVRPAAEAAKRVAMVTTTAALPRSDSPQREPRP